MEEKLNEKKLYLDKNGYNEYLKSIEELFVKLKENSKSKKCSYHSAVGDGWHDNFDFEEAKRIEVSLVMQINNKNEELKNIVIVENDNSDDSIVNINDVVELKFIFDEDEELEKFKLTGGCNPKEYDDYREITLNSPIGKAIYKQKLGNIVEYIVSSKKFNVQILRKVTK
ncbi:MAG: hypothetical protein PHG18_01800 [Bacilli bacterium]|nr:hypothetical protein [Bacilli bacterium]